MAMPYVIVYTRFSPRPGAAKSDSNRRQLQRCRDYCKAKGYRIVGVRWDREMSGKSDDRPGLKRAIAQAKEHKAILLVSKIDRLARSLRDTLNIVADLAESKADLASASEPIDTHSPLGRAFFAIAAVFAQLERETISERTSESIQQKQRAGLRMTRPDRCPYGKRPSPSREAHMIDDPAEQRVIQRIKSLTAEGLAPREIVQVLNKDKVPCRKRGWYTEAVENVLKRAK